MQTNAWLNVRTDDGIQIATITSAERWELIRTLNEVGWFEVVVDGNLDPRILGLDRVVEFWHRPPGGDETLDGVGFMRFWEWFDQDGVTKVIFGGPGPNELLKRRIVAYRPDTSQTTKEDVPADDMMKEVVRENLGPNAGWDWYEESTRNNPAAHWSVADDEGLAADIRMSFPWRNVFDVLKEMANMARDRHTPVYFECDYVGPSEFMFKIWIDRRGTDRSITGNLNPMLFSVEKGNLEDPRLRLDWTKEINYVLAGGGDKKGRRDIDPENDTEREWLTIWNRREGWVDAREEINRALYYRSAAAREAGRPKLSFSAKIIDSPGTRYGKDWFLGDFVTARYVGMDVNAEIETVQVLNTADKGFEVAAGFNVEDLFVTSVSDYPFDTF